MHHPEVAKEFAEKTPRGAELPYHVKEQAQDEPLRYADEDYDLAGDAIRQKAAGHNPPSWAEDGNLWDRAEEAASKTYSTTSSIYWPSVVKIYKSMGGTIAGKIKHARDATTGVLERILAGDDYETIPAVPLFDEHDEHDDKGQVIRRFDRKKLQEIAEATNRREQETGDLAPFGPGHTIDNAPEQMQPPPWGFYRNFRVGTFGPSQKTGILADMIVRKDRKAEALTYPRRSIELWTKDNIIDWIALLRRTPERDLGLLTYARDRGVFDAGPAQPVYYDPTRKRPTASRLSLGGKLRYAMEANSVDNVNVPDDEFERFCALMDRYEARRLKYSAGPGFPGAGNPMIPAHTTTGQATPPPAAPPASPAPPAVVKEDDRIRLQREADMIRFSRLEAELSQVRAQANYATCEALVKGLLFEGVECDPAAEIAALLPLDGKGRQARMDYVRRYHKKDPTSSLWVPVAGDAARPRETTVEERNAAVSYASKNNCSYEEALARTRPA